MLYTCIKILHILSASLLISCMGYSYHLWKQMQSPRDGAIRMERIQALTWSSILPLAFIQLISGFTMIGLQHEDMSQLWISVSLIGFVTVLGAWLSFLYLMMAAQQIDMREKLRARGFSERGLYYRRLQSMMLMLCALAIGTMMFFMTNKVA
jgi:uncharacterized membrane protein